jgi:hypothetical protein
MTQIEYSPEGLFLTTDDRSELLEIIRYISKHFDRLKTRNQKAVTLFEYFEIQPPPNCGDKLTEPLGTRMADTA